MKGQRWIYTSDRSAIWCSSWNQAVIWLVFLGVSTINTIVCVRESLQSADAISHRECLHVLRSRCFFFLFFLNVLHYTSLSSTIAALIFTKFTFLSIPLSTLVFFFGLYLIPFAFQIILQKCFQWYLYKLGMQLLQSQTKVSFETFVQEIWSKWD